MSSNSGEILEKIKQDEFEGNRLIAEVLFKVIFEIIDKVEYAWFPPNSPIFQVNMRQKVRTKDLGYSTSWNWFMGALLELKKTDLYKNADKNQQNYLDWDVCSSNLNMAFMQMVLILKQDTTSNSPQSSNNLKQEGV